MTRAALICGIALLANGCSDRTEASAIAHDAVRQKAAECGIAPNQIVWELDDEGRETALLTTNGDPDNFSGAALTCMLKWAEKSGARISFISEPPPPAEE